MKQLSADTVRLLSSSQVITSVVNVVKELLENSLDAGASSIDVKLENYGLDRIEVRDNGQGIKAADTAVMAVRHFTSKICSHEDLEQLETYGFRGEALGSVCAVAEVAVTTKTEDDDISTQYTLNCTGGIVSQKPSHLGQGTTVSVLKLFKNLPVRRQYYSSTKKCKEEVKKVQDLLMAYAIIKPDLRLTLAHNKVVVWQKAKVVDHRSALLATLGPGTVANLLPCHHRQEQPEIFLDGFFPKPGADYSSTSTSTPDKTFIFVNNRPVHQKDIMKLLRQHYNAQYPDDRNRYPTLMLKIVVSPSSVDVNLTPDKTQVLLHNKEAVLTAVEALLVSLYGFRPSGDPPPEKQLSHETSSPSSPLQTDASQPGDETSVERDVTPDDRGGDVLEDAPERCDAALSTAGSTDVPLNSQTSNGSSSSSIAEDWIVNQIPDGLESNFSLYDDETANTGSRSPESCEDNGVLDADTSKDGLSAEDWSRGTALTDPVSGEPLQPVEIHQPSKHNHSDTDEIKSSSNKKVFNVITEKRAALTAYDLISNRVMRAPLSPAALYEKEVRAEVLREKPTASLQDISVAVHERWKNLREEDRKKSLGGAEYFEALCYMKKQNPDLNGTTFISDPRIVANGFKIRLTPGLTSAERHLEVTAMADCVPFLGVEDLREILTAVLHRKASTVHECRPLKVTNYLQGEAVRLARQLPSHLSREDVQETLQRMEQQLDENNRTCFHGRPFLQHLTDIPRTDEEAEALLKPLEL
ncbi:PMS1 protein homolog 1 isoform X3 [Thunnus maccoyii]|uniref:PMS1 protein homolog 1 isoform X3 n=1 Tax=Thunnus maccoyii TaxID=8240 RepID=UPI001C4D3593|nr:PMS1 protein homolog 1 isoform X3 [Thunnus maccoyii]